MARSRAGPPQPVDEGAAPSPAAQAANRSARILPLIAFPVAVWALLPPYSGPALNTAAKVEFVDHVVPSVAILLVAVASHVLARTRPKPEGALFMCGLVVLLAGIWMTATHLPLVAQATREEAPWGATIYHSTPGLAVVGLGLLWAAAFWRDPPAREAEKAA